VALPRYGEFEKRGKAESSAISARRDLAEGGELALRLKCGKIRVLKIGGSFRVK
jgi:hypothetical protein